MSVHILGVDNAAYWEFTKAGLDNFTIMSVFLKSLFFARGDRVGSRVTRVLNATV